MRNPEEVLSEKLMFIGVETEILKTDEQLFELFCHAGAARLDGLPGCSRP